MVILFEIVGLAAAVFLLEDAAIIGVGLAVASGKISWTAAVTGVMMGILAGDLLYFLAGRYLGRWGLTRPPFKWFVRKEHLAKCKVWIAKSRGASIIGSRFVPSLRSAVPFAVGLADVPLLSALIYFAFAAALYGCLLVSGVAYFGKQFESYLQVGYDYSLFVVVGIVAVLFLVASWLAQRRRRRLVLLKEKHPADHAVSSAPLESVFPTDA